MLDALKVGTDELYLFLLEFKVILHPPLWLAKRTVAKEAELSAWKSDCALSLLMGLVVHLSVRSVEVGKALEFETLLEFDLDLDDGDQGVPADPQDTQGSRRVPEEGGGRQLWDQWEVSFGKDGSQLPPGSMTDPPLISHSDSSNLAWTTTLPIVNDPSDKKSHSGTNP